MNGKRAKDLEKEVFEAIKFGKMFKNKTYTYDKK